jgi:hypothetical protein
VENIVKKRTNKKGNEELYVRWLGYGEKFNSWIPASNFINSFQNNFTTERIQL